MRRKKTAKGVQAKDKCLVLFDYVKTKNKERNIGLRILDMAEQTVRNAVTIGLAAMTLCTTVCSASALTEVKDNVNVADDLTTGISTEGVSTSGIESSYQAIKSDWENNKQLAVESVTNAKAVIMVTTQEIKDMYAQNPFLSVEARDNYLNILTEFNGLCDSIISAVNSGDMEEAGAILERATDLSNTIESNITEINTTLSMDTEVLEELDFYIPSSVKVGDTITAIAKATELEWGVDIFLYTKDESKLSVSSKNPNQIEVNARGSVFVGVKDKEGNVLFGQTVISTIDGVAGDADVNSITNSADALAILQNVVGVTPLEGAAQLNADVDGDDRVDSEDALQILQYVVRGAKNLDSSIPTYPEPPTTSDNINATEEPEVTTTTEAVTDVVVTSDIVETTKYQSSTSSNPTSTGGTNSNPVTTTKQEVKETTIATTTQQPVVTTTEATTTEAPTTTEQTTTEEPIIETTVAETEYPGQGLTWEGSIRWGCQNAEQMAFVETTLDTVLAEKWDWAWDAVDPRALAWETETFGGDEYLAHMVLAVHNIAGQCSFIAGETYGDEGYDSAYQYMVGLHDCGGEAQIRRAIWNRFGFETELVVCESLNHGWLVLYYNGQEIHIDGGTLKFMGDNVPDYAADMYFVNN